MEHCYMFDNFLESLGSIRQTRQPTVQSCLYERLVLAQCTNDKPGHMHFDENGKEECVLRYSFFPEKKNYIIDAIHKWLPIHYSFVSVQISLPSLVVMC